MTESLPDAASDSNPALPLYETVPLDLLRLQKMIKAAP